MSLEQILIIPLETFGNYLPLFFILIGFIANTFPLIPEEVFLITLGYMISKGISIYPFHVIAFLVIIGLLLADLLVYYLAFKGNKVTNKILKKYLKIDLEENQIFLKDNINKIIFFSRFLAQMRALGPILSGITHFPFKKFLKINLLALFIYTSGVMWLGFYFSNRIGKIIEGANILNNIIFGVLVLISIIVISIKMRKKFFFYLHKLKNTYIVKK